MPEDKQLREAMKSWSEELTTEVNKALSELHNRLVAVEDAVGITETPEEEGQNNG